MNKILIVEDEQSIAEMVKLCLCKNGYMCEIVNDGMAATQKIEEKRYDLILLAQWRKKLCMVKCSSMCTFRIHFNICGNYDLFWYGFVFLSTTAIRNPGCL